MVDTTARYRSTPGYLTRKCPASSAPSRRGMTPLRVLGDPCFTWLVGSCLSLHVGVIIISFRLALHGVNLGASVISLGLLETAAWIKGGSRSPLIALNYPTSKLKFDLEDPYGSTNECGEPKRTHPGKLKSSYIALLYVSATTRTEAWDGLFGSLESHRLCREIQLTAMKCRITNLDADEIKWREISAVEMIFRSSSVDRWNGFHLVERSSCSTLIEEGAIELVLPGNFPIGCNSAVLTVINSDNKDDYDQFGCLKAYNTFIKYYNGKLKQAIKMLRQKNSKVKIIYFDYYDAAKCLFQEPHKYGFPSGKNETFRACCGKGEPYNFNINVFCGSSASTVCSDPSKHINWDGPHFTEAAYKQIAKRLVEGPFANPSLKSPPFKIA
ncbi:hypothetical protein VNO77_39413 [Canavalia gladiata]|uniref:Uncharacterized protein n=1 Tax=Canavalia gladiata TaxID=3824 RepID=A0AAN9KAF1_CANGL